MQSLLLLTKKNLKLLFRSKSSSLIVFFAPLLTILILGLSYNTSSQYGLNIGIFAPSFSDDVNSVVKALEEQNFRVVTYQTSIEECVGDIKVGAIHTCISLPEQFAVEGNAQKEVTFYLDPSRINLVWMIQETLKTQVDFKAQEISQNLAQDLLARLADTKTKISERKGDLNVIKDKSSAASSSVQTANDGLVAIDLLAPETVYDTAIVNTASLQIQAAKDNLATALSEINDVNMSSARKASIAALITEADTSLSSAIISVNGTETTSIAQILAGLQNDLNAAKGKLSAAAASISSSASGLGSATATLQEANSAIDTLQGALSEIQTNLEGQKVTEAGTIVNPLVTRIERVTPESTYLNYTFPTLLVLVIMFTSLLLGTILVMMEKNSPAFLRNFFLPLKKTTFIISTYLTNLTLIVVQIAIILGISLLFLKDSLPFIPAIALILFISASVFTFLGMAIGYIFTSEETGVLASISLGSVLLFLSGVILPIETISPLLREITAFSPFVLSEKIIREIFIFRAPLSNSSVDLLILAGYAVVLFLVILIIESVLHQHLVHKFMKQHHKQHRLNDAQNKNDV